MQEGDAAESRAAGCGGVARHTCRSAQRPLDLVKKDLREGSDGSGSVGQHAPQSLRHGDHPLSHGHRRDDVIGEVCGGLCHVAAVAGWTHTAALAGEGHDESRAARHADRAGESEEANRGQAHRQTRPSQGRLPREIQGWNTACGIAGVKRGLTLLLPV